MPEMRTHPWNKMISYKTHSTHHFKTHPTILSSNKKMSLSDHAGKARAGGADGEEQARNLGGGSLPVLYNVYPGEVKRIAQFGAFFSILGFVSCDYYCERLSVRVRVRIAGTLALFRL